MQIVLMYVGYWSCVVNLIEGTKLAHALDSGRIQLTTGKENAP